MVEISADDTKTFCRLSVTVQYQGDLTMPIKDKAYNDAKAILTKAGSKTASKTHTSHTSGAQTVPINTAKT